MINKDMEGITEAGVREYNLATFSWYINNICQYRCSYCSVTPWLLQKTFDKKYHDVYKTVLKKLSLNRIPPFNIEVQGGEPTLHPHFHEILKNLNNNIKCKKIELQTNITKSIKFFKNLDAPEYNKLEIVASYHPEYHKKDTYVEKLTAFNTFKHITSHPNITLSDNKKYWNETISILEGLKNNNVPFGLNILHNIDGFYNPGYSNDFYEIFEPYLEEAIIDVDKVPYTIDGKPEKLSELEIHTRELYKFKGFNCTALMWMIGVDGKITNACTHAPLDHLATNVNKTVKCPGPAPCGGCLDPLQYYYHKTRDG